MAKKKKKASAKPTNLKIVHDGNKFTFSWDRGKTANSRAYAKISCKFRKKQSGKWTGWSSVANQTGKSSWSFTVDLSVYFPTSGKPTLNAVEALISVCERDTDKINYTAVATSKVYDIKSPAIPVFEAPTVGAGSTTYAYSVAGAGTKDSTVFSRVVYNLAAPTYDADPKTYSSWGTNYTSLSASGSITHPIGASSISSSEAVKSMIRIKSQGAGGEHSDPYAYSSVIYSFPYAAVNLSGSAPNQSTGTSVNVSWDTKADAMHPVNENKVQYFIGTPANSSLACPAGANWQDGTEYMPRRPAVRQSASFYTDSRPAEEECMWLRVMQRDVLTLETPSNEYLVRKNIVPVAPNLTGVTYNAQTNALSVSVSNESSLPGASVTTQFIANGKVVLTLNGNDPSTTYNLGSSQYTVKSFATFSGNKSSAATISFDPTVQCSEPAKYSPTNVRASAGSTAGTVAVSWTNVMRGVTSAEVAVATSPSGTYETEATVTGNNPTSATVSGLAYDVQYYFKVSTTNSAGESGLSANYGSYKIPISQVPAPNLTLATNAAHDIIASWSWDTWTDADKIELLWSTDPQVGDSNNYSDADSLTIDRDNRRGSSNYIIKDLEWNKTWYVWARYGKDDVWTRKIRKEFALTVVIPAPTNVSAVRSAQSTDEEGETTVRVTWACSNPDITEFEVEWSDNANALTTSSGAESTTVPTNRHDVYIPGLTLGKTWYFWVTSVAGDHGTATSSRTSFDLRTTPAKPVITLSNTDIYQYGTVDVSWNYSCEDLAPQQSARIEVYHSGTKIGTVSAQEEQSVILYAEQLGLQPDENYILRMVTTSANGKASAYSSDVSLHCTGKPMCAITNTSLVTATIGEGEYAYTVLALESLPLTMTITGTEHGGYATVYIERSKTIFLEKPDESTGHGFEGELITLKEADADGTISFDMNDLRTPFEDMNDYRIIATVTNQYGTSDPAELEFTCLWAHQAIIPDGTLVMDPVDNIAKITPVAPEGIEEDDVADIYRLSTDRPELIVRDAEWGTTYVDPYPALGERCGYRIVTRTSEGDYTTAEDTLAWLDLEADPALDNERAIIDFDSNTAEVIYNVDVSQSWTKDFTETQYLGGSVQGDWNPAVSRTASIGTVLVDPNDSDTIEAMRRLSTYPGICHVRTPDGSSFAADVQVSSEKASYANAGKLFEYSVEITRVDTEGFDGMTLAAYEAEQEEPEEQEEQEGE